MSRASDDPVRRAWRRARRELHRIRGQSEPRGPVTPASQPFLAPIPPRTPTADGPTVVVLNDCRDQVNFGAEALVDGLVTILGDAVPEAQLQPVPSHWLIDPAGGFGAFVDGGRGLRQPDVGYPGVADQFDAVADDWLAGRGGRDVPELLARFEGADLVLLNGEGSIYRTNVSAIRELFLAWFAKTRLGIPTIFVNGGVHLVDVVPVLPAMVGKTFAALDAVAVREPCSLRNVRAWFPDVDVRMFPDSAFVFGPDVAHESPAVTAVRERIGDAPYFCFDPGPMPIDARPGGRSALHRLCTELATDGRRAVLVCSAPADAFMKPIATETGALYVDTITHYREFMALTAGADFLVSGRYHNPILAAITGCPTIALASTNHKVHGALEVLDGVLGTPFDGTSLFPALADIRRRADDYAANRDAWGERLRSICDARRRDVVGMGALVRRFAVGPP